MTPDLINGLFELLASVFIALHIRAILKDREVKGVSVSATTFFFAWGVWNVFFYPSQGLWWSFVGGLTVVIANLIYLGALFYFGPLQKRRQRKEDIRLGLTKCKRGEGHHFPEYIGCDCLR